MDKILTDRTHDVSIYSINTPLMSESDIMQVEEEVVADSFCMVLDCCGDIGIVGAWICYIFLVIE